jgi:hypothetical protein
MTPSVVMPMMMMVMVMPGMGAGGAGGQERDAQGRDQDTSHGGLPKLWCVIAPQPRDNTLILIP